MTLLPVTLFLYVTAMVFALLDGGFPHRSLYRLFLVCAWAGFLIESAALGSVWAHRGIPPAVNLHELFLVTAWAILGLYLLLYPMIQSRRILPFFLMPLVTLNFLLGNAIPETAVEPKPYYFSAWFAVHILLLVFGMATGSYALIFAPSLLSASMISNFASAISNKPMRETPAWMLFAAKPKAFTSRFKIWRPNSARISTKSTAS